MRIASLCLLSLLALPSHVVRAQGTVPVFAHAIGQNTYTLLGHDPAQPASTTIPTVLVPITLAFESKKVGGKPFLMDAAPDAPRLLASPVFSKYAFTNGGSTQFADAMLRATFPKAEGWHTLFAKPEVKPVKITVPAGDGYVLSSKKGGYFAVVDVQFVQKEIFKQIPKQDGKLVIAVTHNTTFYADADATECCLWGTHGVDSATGNSFVLGSVLHAAPAVVEDGDMQPLTQQLGEFVNDPLHDPLARGGRGVRAPGNAVPSWSRPIMNGGDQGGCGGASVATQYFLLEPTNTNPKNNIPASRGYVAEAGGASYRLQNVALLQWYTGDAESLGSTYSFPDPRALPEPAKPCAAGRGRGGAGGGGAAPAGRGSAAPPQPTVAAAPLTGPPNGHELIGYYSGYAGNTASLRDISPQWDVIIVAFATPDHNAPEGTMQFRSPAGQAADQFKADIAYKKSLGKKVMISLGGGGQNFTLASPESLPVFVSTVTKIVADYAFDGVDIDFETPSLDIDPGDTDFKHPTTPSIVHIIAALRQLHDHFGPGFMISLVPEGTQIPSGLPTYGGQFGSYLPIMYALRDILSFSDTQSYNTPPLEGLDGEIYQPGTLDYHAAMTELVLHGFNVGGDPKQFFPPLPANKVAVGFLTGDTTPAIVGQAMDFIITGKAPAGAKYKLQAPKGYPGMIGAMFWTLDADRRSNYNYSNLVGPQLHAYPAAK